MRHILYTTVFYLWVGFCLIKTILICIAMMYIYGADEGKVTGQYELRYFEKEVKPNIWQTA
jgi:hypothetical protein